MTRVVFALERNASTDPPEEGSVAWTSYGAPLYYMKWTTYQDPFDDDDEGVERLGWHTPDGTGGMAFAFPQPSYWYDLRPSDEPLTTEHLEELCDPTFGATGKAYTEAARARLRAALDALDG